VTKIIYSLVSLALPALTNACLVILGHGGMTNIDTVDLQAYDNEISTCNGRVESDSGEIDCIDGYTMTYIWYNMRDIRPSVHYCNPENW
jgi:hypothetical protein